MSTEKAVNRICQAVQLKGHMNCGELAAVILEEGLDLAALEDVLWQCHIENQSRLLDDARGALGPGGDWIEVKTT